MLGRGTCPFPEYRAILIDGASVGSERSRQGLAEYRDRTRRRPRSQERHWVNLLRQIHSALASRPTRSARTATLRAPWQPSTRLAHARPGYPYPLASPTAAARPTSRTPRAARARDT